MASYKVPQDVEADDKLIGPFSFRQFVYIIIVALAGAAAWGLAQLFVGLAILPLPIIVFFGALALPLRKDQPMEIYMAAMVSYYLKPRNRRWDPEGIESLIEISAPKVVEVRRTKDLSQNEAEERLSYLANIVDSGGWAIRGVNNPGGNSSLNSDVYLEAQGAQDILDTSTSIAQNFDQMMSQSTERMHEEARARMLQANAPQPAPVAFAAPAAVAAQAAIATQAVIASAPTAAAPQITTQPLAPQVFNPAVATVQAAAQNQPLDTATIDPATIQFNPYPTFHQSIIQPLGDTNHQARSDITNISPQTPITAPQIQANPTSVTQPTAANPTISDTNQAKGTSDTQLTADIINLANNPDISIETIALEAHRIHKKAEEESDEVIISLR